MKKKKVIILCSLIGLLLLIVSVGILTYAQSDDPLITDKEVSETQVDAQSPLHESTAKDEEAYTEIMGFGRLEVDLTYPYIYLINPSDNDVYLSFDVIYNDKVLHQTGLISPGKMEEFNILECLDAGEHTLTYSISSFDLNTKQILWSGIKQNQDILIKK